MHRSMLGEEVVDVATPVVEDKISYETSCGMTYESPGENEISKKAAKKNARKAAEKKGRKGNLSKKSDPEWPEEMVAFFQEMSWTFDWKQILVLEERMFLLPDGMTPLQGIRQIRSGLYLGDVKKKRFEPSQALAMALRPEEYPRVLTLKLGDDRVERYLKGETIDGEVADGWVLICVDEFPLGWGKAAKGKIKNKYYKGWRKN